MMRRLLFTAMILSGPLATGEPIGEHNKEMRELTAKLSAYEKRVAELVEEKKKKKPGPDLEDVLTEISDLQKELVGIKKKRRILREHIQTNHPADELLDDLSLLKDSEPTKGKSKKDPDVDARLDTLLETLRKQYARTDRTDQEDAAEEQKRLAEQFKNRKNPVKEEEKKEYIKENIKTQLKIE